MHRSNSFSVFTAPLLASWKILWPNLPVSLPPWIPKSGFVFFMLLQQGACPLFKTPVIQKNTAARSSVTPTSRRPPGVVSIDHLNRDFDPCRRHNHHIYPTPKTSPATEVALDKAMTQTCLRLNVGRKRTDS